VCRTIFCCLPLVCGATLASYPTQQTETVPRAESQPAATTRPAGQFWLSLSTAPYPDGLSDEAGYEDYLRRIAASIGQAAEQDQEPLDAAEHHLAAANWILARLTEPAVTRLLLGRERSDDRQTLRSAVAQARAHLDAGRALLASVADAQEPAAPEARSDLELSLGTLSAFAEALAVAWADDQEDHALQAQQAASTLGILLEDERPAVAVTATLYQALLYQRADQAERALAVLDLAMGSLPVGGEAPAFFARVLRCRLLAQQGGYATAWALLLRLEERAYDWFETDQTRQEAARAVSLVRLATAEAWRDELAESGRTAQADWCQRAADQIAGQLGEDPPPGPVLRLGFSIPLLLDNYDFNVNPPVAEAAN
jgi:hypothetical protein